jgi:hypothetical protein
MKFNIIETFALALTLLSPLSGHADPIASELGKGVLSYDKGAGLKDGCVNFSNWRVSTEDARITDYELILIRNKEELSDKIMKSASGKGSFGGFGASVKTSFVKDVEWNFTSNYILVRATRISKRQNLNESNILLSLNAQNILRNSRITFLESCGDAFTNSIEMGGEVFGLLEITAENYELKQKIEASLKASGSFTGGSASGKASYEETIRKLSAAYRVKISFKHIGGSSIQVPNTAEGLLEISNRIEEISDAFPVVVSAQLREYTTLSNYVVNNDPDTQVRQNAIDWAQGKLNLARNLYSKILYILEYQKDFARFDEEALKEKLTYLDQKILALKDFIARSANFSYESDVQSLNLDLNIDLPEMKRRPSNRALRVQCQETENQICGVANYKLKASGACLPVAIAEGTGPVCGEIFKLAESKACEPDTYNVGEGAVCGAPLLYKACYHGKPRGFYGKRSHGRHPSCGVEKYPSCAHSSFGVATYKSCRAPSHGHEAYKTCRDPSFGYEFGTCRDISHGPESFKSCNIAIIGGQETTCPRF